ncbi:glycosyltransferase family 4 protein [Novosphingobium panipatense]|uniref:Glycosyltransferase involved in cell wall bisynthesis n=1 Tax=Novosphingobium panipatense TaxID=428991 RepID=A0ABY1QL99_9SPHN|nr:glycosyltransferase family 4 protein [Novosphingobium panipatense]SMP71872.1 Glycosyltransferase involved in cell wall bisynthesis [Novosphingobium panipatense]
MKILVLSSLAYSLTNFRGALLREMIANGHTVLAVAPDHNDAVAQELKSSGIGFRVVPMQRTGTNPIHDVASLYRYARLIMYEKPDLILAYTQKPIIYGGLAARLVGGRRFFALMSGLGYVYSPHNDKRQLLRKAVSFLYREAVRRTRAIFVFNADDRQDMLDFGIVNASHRVVQVPGSGVDLAHFPHVPLPRTVIRFLFVGRLMRDKGVYEFLEAARRISRHHPTCEFMVLGHYERANPTGIDEAECLKLAAEYPVRFVPGTTDVRPYLAGCSVFVLPSYYREGLPRTIIEAMSCGRPIVTTDTPGCREPVTEGENGFLVPPRDVDALAIAMQRFIDNPELIGAMGARSRAIAEATYDVRKVNRQLLDEMDLLVETWKPQVIDPGQPANDREASPGAAGACPAGLAKAETTVHPIAG